MIDGIMREDHGLWVLDATMSLRIHGLKEIAKPEWFHGE